MNKNFNYKFKQYYNKIKENKISLLCLLPVLILLIFAELLSPAPIPYNRPVKPINILILLLIIWLVVYFTILR